MENQNEEGQDVAFTSGGQLLNGARPSFDVDKLNAFIEANAQKVNQFVFDVELTRPMKEVQEMFLAKKGIMEGTLIFNSWSYHRSEVLTTLTYSVLDFDSEIEVSPIVGEMLDMYGFVSVLSLWPKEAHEFFKKTGMDDTMYTGPIKIVSLQEIFH